MKSVHSGAGFGDAEGGAGGGGDGSKSGFHQSFVVVHREGLEAEEKCEISLDRWGKEGSLDLSGKE